MIKKDIGNKKEDWSREPFESSEEHMPEDPEATPQRQGAQDERPEENRWINEDRELVNGHWELVRRDCNKNNKNDEKEKEQREAADEVLSHDREERKEV